VTLVSFLLCLVYVDVLTTTSCSKDDPVNMTGADAADLPPDGVAVVDSKPADGIAADAEDDTALADAPTDSPADTPTDTGEPDGLLDAPVDTMIMVDAGVDAPPIPIDAMEFPIDAMEIDAPPFIVDAPPFVVDAPPFLPDAAFPLDAPPPPPDA
jgi:hypothetical protein